MTTTDALDLIHGAAKLAPLPLTGHEQVHQAVELLRQTLEPKVPKKRRKKSA